MELEGYISAEPVDGTGIDAGSVFNAALDALRNARIGKFAVAFPQAREGKSNGAAARMRPTLGDKFQVFGPKAVVEAAERLMAERFSDYLHVTGYRPVRQTPRHVCFRRVRSAHRTTATVEREIRRSIKRAEAGKRPPLSADELVERQRSTRPSDAPYVTVRSHTNGQRFNAAFEKVIGTEPSAGEFDEFGFSRGSATVPYLP